MKFKNCLFLVLIIVANALTSNSYAATTSVCNPATPVVFGFFNGVLTTRKEGIRALVLIESHYKPLSVSSQPIQYELLYNHSNGFEDFVQTFEQRLKEQDGLLAGRFELFFSAIKGGGDWWTKINQVAISTIQLLDTLKGSALATAVRTLAVLVASPPDYQNYAEHRTKIDGFVAENKRLLFFAHSQGNLFANQAFDYAKPKLSTGAIKLIHVAPASPTLRGVWTLADLDLVINGLRLTGTVPANTDAIPNYFSRAAGLNGEKDFMGHGMLEIYLNKDLATATRINNQVTTALSDLSDAGCPEYRLVMRSEVLQESTQWTICGLRAINSEYPTIGFNQSTWHTNTCQSRIFVAPQNIATNVYGVDANFRPIFNPAGTACTLTHPNIKYRATSPTAPSPLRFASSASLGNDHFFPANGTIGQNTPTAWGLLYDAYISGELPYGRSPGTLTATCQKTYSNSAASAKKVITASISIPNVLVTSQFEQYDMAPFFWASGRSWPKVITPNCSLQDCAGMLP
jgi:hypothetical protein